MGVMRLGYVHARVTDLNEAKQHYQEHLGMYPTLEEDGRVFFKGWEEWDHHSVVLEEGGVGVAKFGWKVQYESDIDDIERKAMTFGCQVERMSAGENPEISDGIRILTPSAHVMEVYHDATQIGLELGTHNPEVFPRDLVGIGVPTLDHTLITAEDAGLAEQFFHDVFGFWTTEKVNTEADGSGHTIASFMTGNNQVHQIAVLEGPQAKLHHFAFRLEDWSAVGRAADLCTINDVPINLGPTRHGITKGTTVYFFDPAGNRNEVFAGGYLAMPDRPMIVWTPDQIGKGIFYHAREVNEGFTGVLT